MTWEFNESIAASFESHASKHIPQYYKIITQTADILEHVVGLNAKVIDVGSAVGTTLTYLSNRGFTNLYGVESSAAMIKKMPPMVPGVKQVINSSLFPTQSGPFDAIINWTLHFIKKKEDYLTELLKGLTSNGVVIISDKTNNSTLMKHFYYQTKIKNGYYFTKH